MDDRDNIVDQSVNQNIWADGDVKQWFDNDSVIASGDRSIAAGDDADVDDSNNIEDSYNDNSDNSTDNSTDNSIRAGGDVNIGNERDGHRRLLQHRRGPRRGRLVQRQLG